MLYYLYRAARFISIRLPLKWCYRLASFIADVYYLFTRKDKKALRENLKIVLNSKEQSAIEKHVRNVFRNFAKYLVDFFRYEKLTQQYILNYISIVGKENLDKARMYGRGVIIVTAHIGNWELGGAVVASIGYPMNAIALAHKDRRINEFFLRQRAIPDIKVIPIGARLKECFRVLRRNELLAILGDRDFSKYGIEANFFGKTTLLPKGPAIFSLRTGAPIIPAFMLREADDSFRLIFERPIRYTPTEDEEKDVRSIISLYIPVIERYIRLYPDQWYAFRIMWER